mmetsp:Transcript_10500/g.31627  ORF Transcript_10500/g.31627 Transcript_10500/m.31627 type:complete len:200 (+) Transcript_10500:755-1354(+)
MHSDVVQRVLRMVPVEQRHCPRTIRKWARMHLVGPLLPDEVRGNAQFVLVHCQNLLGKQNGLDFGGRRPQVRPNQQRGLHERPQREMGPLLRQSQRAVAHLQHIGVVPGAWPGEAGQTDVVVQATQYILPRGLDVCSRAPAIAHPGCPKPGVCHAPLAHGKHNGAPRSVESVLHRLEAAYHKVPFVRPAVVVFEVVDAP